MTPGKSEPSPRPAPQAHSLRGERARSSPDLPGPGPQLPLTGGAEPETCPLLGGHGPSPLGEGRRAGGRGWWACGKPGRVCWTPPRGLESEMRHPDPSPASPRGPLSPKRRLSLRKEEETMGPEAEAAAGAGRRAAAIRGTRPGTVVGAS